MALPETPGSPVDEPGSRTVSRRTVLKGIAGVTGLASVPALLAACNSAATPSPAASSAPSAAAPSAAAPSAAGSAAVGSTTFGSNYSDAVPKKAMQDVIDAFTAQTGIAVTVNTVEHGKFQDTINAYLQGTPDDVFTWFAGYRMRFFAAQGLAGDISDVWSTIGSHFSSAFKGASTGDDGKQYFVPIYNYPWVVIYRKSLFTKQGYQIPKTIDDFTTLAKKMQSDGLVPLAFGDKDGWPAMGTFDILNMRLNGYDYHVGLMAGKNKWTDAQVKAVFQRWATLLPYHQEAALGRTWQDAAQSMISNKAAMYFLGTFAGQQATDPATHADLDFFPFPLFGTQYDSENAIDAPIDGFMMAAKPKNPDAAKALLGFIGTPKAESIYLASDSNDVAAATDADTSKYNAFQLSSAKIIGASNKIAQFLDRDTRPDFAGPNGMQGFIQKFLSNPTQDLDAYLKGIQAFYDSLPAQ